MRPRIVLTLVAVALMTSATAAGALEHDDPHDHPHELSDKYRTEKERFAGAVMVIRRYTQLAEAHARATEAVHDDDRVESEPGDVTARPSSGSGTCNTIPRYIVERESGCDYSAKNPNSSACGAYQIIDGTWDNYGGYSSACDAPPEIQDQKAAELWAQSPSHWDATR